MFGKNLYDTDETNSFLEIRLALHCLIFEEIKPLFFTVADFFKSSCSEASLVDAVLILYFLECTYMNINTGIRTVKQCTEMSME